jgi:hypothetical protein
MQIKRKTKLNNQNGQAIFEMIFFLPLILILVSMILNIGSAINGSINQQKTTRGYFYARIKNNSNLPMHTLTQTHSDWKLFGMFFVGWKEKFDSGQFPVQPCYKLSIPFVQPDDSEGTCGAYSSETTSFIRVGTVYGVCGTTYYNNQNTVVKVQALAGNGVSAGDAANLEACTIQGQ